MVIIVCVSTAPALDVCLAALDASLPAKTRIVIADDASGDPRVAPLAQHWCQHTHLQANYFRREQAIGYARHRGELIAHYRDSDLVLLDGDAVPAPGWLQQLVHCANTHAQVATLSTWSNSAGLCSFPRFCEDNPLPASLDALALASAILESAELPDLPMAQGPCLFLRGQALRQLGGWDSETFEALGAEVDFCLRAASMGWRNALCPTAFVGRSESAPSEPTGEDLHRLVARWPDYQASLARHFLTDPLRALRERMIERMVERSDIRQRGGPQGDLFE